MSFKQKYRKILFVILVMDLLFLSYLSYRHFDRMVPRELQVVRGEEGKLSELLENPWITFSDAVTTSQSGVYRMESRIFGILPFREVKVRQVTRERLYASGEPVGIYLETDGVLIIDTGEIACKDGSYRDPAKNIARAGDYIVAFNRQRVRTKEELIREINQSGGEKACLSVLRHGEEVSLEMEPVLGEDGRYKLGIWVRDNTQGIGTLTYVDREGDYGALGHGISDIDTGELMQIDRGILYQAQILSVQKGEKGSPGELSGVIRYEDELQLGKIQKNCENGIYGAFTGEISKAGDPLPMGFKQEMKLGEAQILCCVDNCVSLYDAVITKVDMNHHDSNKSFVIQVTDPRLLAKTGGIVQGMSGSPVIQEGKLVGAITHVFVQDAASGYGIFIENMRKENGKM